ncbi:MAG: molybdopterin-dependent oxidoreductase [Chitinophagaceae bacterium]|nr:molybdopterin-dependent oxidoreductase [Chitinophagaceae bacterium]
MDRRKFLKVSSWAGGGMMISFDWFAGQIIAQGSSASLPQTWSELNSYIRIANDGAVTLLSPNPEFGSNVITSMPMILAEELDVDWKSVTVEQADFLPQRFDRQFTGGSQAIRQGWKGLRLAGATARRLLLEGISRSSERPGRMWRAERSSRGSLCLPSITNRRACCWPWWSIRLPLECG